MLRLKPYVLDFLSADFDLHNLCAEGNILKVVSLDSLYDSTGFSSLMVAMGVGASCFTMLARDGRALIILVVY